MNQQTTYDEEYEITLRKRALLSLIKKVNEEKLGPFSLARHSIEKCTIASENRGPINRLRRVISFREIRELPEEDEIDEFPEPETGYYLKKRRLSFPASPRSLEQVRNPLFSNTLKSVRESQGGKN
jgi:hypothetical protein